MIEEHKLTNCPDSVYYLDNFLTEEDQTFLVSNIYRCPNSKWMQLSRRRLQNWGGVPQLNGMIAEPLPKWLQTVVNKVGQLPVFDERKPNHVLINEYQPGQGIMPHLDGPLYFPAVATVNLMSHTVLNFYKHHEEKQSVAFSVYLEPRSLLVQKGDVYNQYMHGIDEIKEDIIGDSICNLTSIGQPMGTSLERGTRISLTIRHVLKSTKLKIQLSR